MQNLMYKEDGYRIYLQNEGRWSVNATVKRIWEHNRQEIPYELWQW